MADFNFKLIADTALSCAESLVAEWLPGGKKVGGEWKACNPLRADHNDGSFSISLTNGRWGDFATDDKGGDLVSLYAYLFCNDDQGAAALYLADRLGLPDAIPPLEKGKKAAAPRQPDRVTPPVAKPAEKKTGNWLPVLPVPADTPEPPRAHEFRGIPEHRWCYRDGQGDVLGYIDRFANSTGGKEIIPLTWCSNATSGKCEWKHVAFPELRPLYGLDGLAQKPGATVLVVEGEKCADAARAELPDLAVVSWPGGGKAVSKADWMPLAGRKVITWADCDSKRIKLTKAQQAEGLDPFTMPLLAEADQPGVKAMAQVREILSNLGCKLWNVLIPGPGGEPDGWDVADAIADGLLGDELAAWIREHVVLHAAPEVSSPAEEAGACDGDQRPVPPNDDWRNSLLWKKGELTDCLANVYDVLANHEDWQGVLGYNEFSLRAMKLKPPPYAHGAEGEWEGVDDSRTAIWMTRAEAIAPSSMRIMEAIETLSRANSYHPVCDWLKSLPAHDGKLRAERWLIDCLGVKDSPYVRLVSRWFLIGMVARVMEPGVKFDTCLVLEGAQGKGKSTALGILGGEWFDDTDLDLNNKDAMASLQGVWLHEFAELGSLAKAEASKQKSFLTRRVDKYRPVYGRRDIKAPRQTAFAGSVNDWEWQKDPTGGRRFWPALCEGDFDLEKLRADRDQLFAEALAAYRKGERFHPTAAQQKELFDPEQLQREAPNNFVDALHDWVYARSLLTDEFKDFSMATAILEGLKLDASKMTTAMSTSVGIALRKLGCTRVEKRNGMVRYWYRPPVTNEASSSRNQPIYAADEDENVPF